MKTILRNSLVLTLVLALVLGTGWMSFAASVSPQPYDGNDPSFPEFINFTVAVRNGTYRNGDFQVTVNYTGNKKALSWTSNIPVSHVFVKGGNGGNLYSYNGVTADSDLRAPNNKGGNQPEVSHVTFYYQLPQDPDPQPVLGSLALQKRVINENEEEIEDETEFNITVVGPEFSRDITLMGGQTYILEELTLGEYIITEATPEGYELVGIQPGRVTLSEENPNGQVLITNKKQSVVVDPDDPQPVLGSITLQKKVINENEEEIEDETEFAITVVGPDFSQEITLIGGQSITLDELVLGEYTITEAATEGYRLVGIQPSSLTLSEENPEAEVLITNQKQTIILEPEVPARELFNLTSICWETPTRHKYRVTNNSEFDVMYRWETYGGGPTGEGTALANSETYFYGAGGTIKLYIYWNEKLVHEYVKATNTKKCYQEPTDPVTPPTDPVTPPTDPVTPPTDPEKPVEVEKPVDEPIQDCEDPTGNENEGVEVEVEVPQDHEDSGDGIELDVEVPEVPAQLPKTGEIPPFVFYGLGGLISLAGYKLRRK